MPKKSLPAIKRLRYYPVDDSKPNKVSPDQAASKKALSDLILNPRTDLALEAQQVMTDRGHELPGVTTTTETVDSATITRTIVESDLGAQLIGKAPGHYVTIQTEGLTGHDRDLERQISQLLADEIRAFLTRFNVTDQQTVLVIGLGNWNATPDNIGPLTVSKLLVTRHLFEYQVLDSELLENMRPVAALSPGVLGLTGIESADIVRAIVDRIQPAAVICVDALASMSVERVGKTVQLSDAGINPGAGVGNRRLGLTQQTLGVPVLAVGVPTVIYATTIVSEAVDLLLKETRPSFPPVDPGLLLKESSSSNQTVLSSMDPIQSLPSDESTRLDMIQRVLGDSMGTLIVTPKEIDVMVETLSDVLADGLNEALHPGISADEAAMLR